MIRRLLPIALLASLVCASPAWAGPPGMPDPAQMSGIPRADPNIPAGTVTVRCLIGGFSNPASGIEATLEITTAAGVEQRTATTAEQGRATFSGLESLYGSTVVARATIAGQSLVSQPFTLGPEAGVALMLVASGDAAPSGPPSTPHGPADDPHGGQGAMPLPGKPFPLAGRPRGTLIVGALDLGGGDNAAMGPIPDVEVRLTAMTSPDAEPIILTAKTDTEGRAQFDNLDTTLPEGAAIIVAAELEPGQPADVSQPFTLGDTAYAVILTRGEGQGAAAPAQQQRPPAAPARVELPPPRADRTLSPGQVRVILVDAHDQPVANAKVIVHSSESTGGTDDHVGTTDAQGMAIIDDVPVSEDMLSQVRVIYEGAPYSSTLFEMPEEGGALVMMRVYRPTGDRTRVRSAMQIDVSPRENDFAAVAITYALFVDGDEAFWVPGGMRLYGPPGTRSLHVMDESKPWLLHDEEAPWVEIDRPLEPGVEIRLSFAVGIQHDGTLELEWSAPFPLVDGASLVSVPEELAVTHGVAGAPEVDPHGRGGDPLELYKLGYQPFALSVCDLLARAQQPCPVGTWAGHDIALVVENLPIRSRVWPYTAWSLLGLTAFGVGLSVALRRRVSPREALLTRRDALVAELSKLDRQAMGPAEFERRRRRIVRTLDRIYRQLEALGE